MLQNNFQYDNPILINKWNQINKKNLQTLKLTQIEYWIKNVLSTLSQTNLHIQDGNIHQFIISYLTSLKRQANVAQLNYQEAVSILNQIMIKLANNEQLLNISSTEKHKNIVQNIQKQVKSNEQKSKIKESSEFSPQRNINSILKKEKQPQNLKSKEQICNQHLQILFCHYCKANYSLKKDLTFQQIQQKVQFLTVNEFLLFCRDFGIVTLPNINRTILVDLFKKTSDLFKKMTLPQLSTILTKIAAITYSQQPSEQQHKTLLQYLKIDNITSFTQKMKQLNIPFIKKTVSLPKIVLQDYKFKFSPDSPQKILKKKIQNKRIIESKVIGKEHNSIKINPIKSHQQIKKLKQGNQKPSKLHKLQISNKKINPDVLGYYNIHMLNKKNTKKYQNETNTRLKINSIIGEAKKIAQQNQFLQSQINSSLYHRRQFSNYTKNRQLSERNEINTPQERQIEIFPIENIQQKKLLYKNISIFPELIDDEQDEDIYLKQHLNREKKNDQFAKKIAQRLKQLDH